VIRLPHAGTIHLPAGVNRDYLNFAGIFIGETSKVSEALQKARAVAGPRSNLRNCMIRFLNSPLVSLQHRLCIMHFAGGQRPLVNHFARGQTKEQGLQGSQCFSLRRAFDPGQPGRHKEQAELDLDMYWRLVDSPIDGSEDRRRDSNPGPGAKFQLEKISACRPLRPQQLFTRYGTLRPRAV
jgi:hypothetical protein